MFTIAPFLSLMVIGFILLLLIYSLYKLMARNLNRVWVEIEHVRDRVYDLEHHPTLAQPRLEFTLAFWEVDDKGNRFLLIPKIKGGIIMSDLKKKQYVIGTVNAVDANGDAASIQEGTLVASSSNTDVALVEVLEGNQIKITSGNLGAAIIKVEADADLGDGVKTISAEVAINVVGGEAVGFGITLGEPVDIVEEEENEEEQP